MPRKIKKWYMFQTDYDDVIVTSRVRLARNLAEYQFPEKLADDVAEKLIDRVRAITPELTGREGYDFYSCNVQKLTELERQALVEEHAISPMLAAKEHPTGLILAEDETISVMINEEDHLRIQAINPGNSLRRSFNDANRIDDYIDSRMHYAYSDKYGYLTSCMTNVGTGLRASYMLSLPALTVSGKLAALQDEIGKYGIVIRGLYGEGTKSAGFMYQISNQKTLGCSEQDIIENLDQITSQVVALEHRKREEWVEKEHDELEDKIYRSYGILRYTRSVTTKDAMMLLAQVKLGSDLGLIKLRGNGLDIHRLMMEIQPSILQTILKQEMSGSERDKARARYINEELPILN